MALHLTVVVAVNLREYKQKGLWILKNTDGETGTSVGEKGRSQNKVQQQQSWLITVKYEQINSWGIVSGRVSGDHCRSSPQDNEG